MRKEVNIVKNFKNIVNFFKYVGQHFQKKNVA
jgi:hypothetical protein